MLVSRCLRSVFNFTLYFLLFAIILSFVYFVWSDIVAWLTFQSSADENVSQEALLHRELYREKGISLKTASLIGLAQLFVVSAIFLRVFYKYSAPILRFKYIFNAIVIIGYLTLFVNLILEDLDFFKCQRGVSIFTIGMEAAILVVTLGALFMVAVSLGVLLSSFKNKERAKRWLKIFLWGVFITVLTVPFYIFFMSMSMTGVLYLC